MTTGAIRLILRNNHGSYTQINKIGKKLLFLVEVCGQMGFHRLNWGGGEFFIAKRLDCEYSSGNPWGCYPPPGPPIRWPSYHNSQDGGT
jgi:hypothetical protein